MPYHYYRSLNEHVCTQFIKSYIQLTARESLLPLVTVIVWQYEYVFHQLISLHAGLGKTRILIRNASNIEEKHQILWSPRLITV